MAGFTDALEASILNHFFGASPLLSAPPLGYEIALYETPPNDDGTGGTEASYAGYSRPTILNTETNFPAATPGDPARKTNGTAWVFPAKTDAGSVNLSSWALISATDSTTIYHFGLLDPNPLPVAQGEAVVIAVGGAKIEAGDPGDTFGA